MDIKLKPLPIEDDKGIREGMKLAGLGEYLTSTIRLGEYEPIAQDRRVIIATLTLETTQVLDKAYLRDAFSAVDRLMLLGNHIGKDMQIEMAKQLPCISIGDKVIMSRDDYLALRKGLVTEFRV